MLSRLSATLAAGALLGSAACHDVTAPVQQSPLVESSALIPADVLAALADVDARVVPALEAEARVPMRAALHALRGALLTGDTAAARRAIAVVRELSARADADLSAIALVVDVTAQAIVQ